MSKTTRPLQDNSLRRSWLLLALVTVLSLSTTTVRADRGLHEWAFIRLDYARQEKVQQLRRLCEQVHELATRAREDELMLKFFDVNLKCFALAQEGTPPEELTKKTAEFRKTFNEYYVRNWLAFYDILFIDKQGLVFYSIRKEQDFEQNMFEGDLSRTPLAQCLRKNPQEETFVDFHYYAISDEPGAFFVEPIRKDGEHVGWIVLQFAINKINSLFAGAEQLGETGEALVVNREGYMLTESNFEGNSTILKKKLSNENIEAKFRERQGHRTVTDYRGFTALTSFEVIDFMGTQWLVVVKVDEAQVTTEHFMQHRNYYNEHIVQYLTHAPTGKSEDTCLPTDRKTIRRVDMDEFVKADHNELLQTLGVSTCTAIIATYPGKFGYLAHISPVDRIYAGETTNVLGHITKKIKTYDIYKFERRRVRFVIVATHLDSLISIIDKLTEEGFLLAQISVMYHPQAECANVIYDYSKDYLSVAWLPDQPSANKVVQHASDLHNIGTVVKQCIDE